MAVPIAFDESATIPHYLVISALFMKIPHSNPCQQTRIFISTQQLLDSYFYLLMDRRFTLVEERQNSVQPWNKQVKNRAILTWVACMSRGWNDRRGDHHANFTAHGPTPIWHPHCKHDTGAVLHIGNHRNLFWMGLSSFEDLSLL